ncbi:MAG: hypothetical protein KAS32_06895 [Candidatus Peribacteraceae bacterium]|nr:hypothetical protein [Candidatus Peribacteraceae bacterium]
MSEKIKIIEIHNLLDIGNQTSSFIIAENLSVYELVERQKGHIDVNVGINGHYIEPEDWLSTFPSAGDTVVFIPELGNGEQDKQVIVWVIIILMYIYAPQLAGYMSTTFGGSVAFWSAVIMIAGGMLISSLQPEPKSPKLQAGQDQRFAWNKRTIQLQGVPVPIVYGEYKLNGNIIAVNTEIFDDGKQQRLKMIVALSSGPIKSISNVKLNDQPEDNYSAVTTESKLGNVEQTAVSFFGETKPEYTPNVLVSDANGAYEWTTPELDADWLEIDINFPRGLYKLEPGHKPKAWAVSFTIEIKPVGGSYSTLFDSNVLARGFTPFWNTYLSTGSYTGGNPISIERGTRYTVRITKVSGDYPASVYGDVMYLTSIRTVLNKSYKYPSTALVGVDAIANKQLSGQFAFSCEVEGKIVAIFDGIDWTVGYSNNPAWVLYDIVTQPVISGDGDGTPYAVEFYEGYNPNHLDEVSFKAFADYCAVEVNDGNGGVSPRLSFNGIFSSDMSMWDCAMDVCRTNHCLLSWSGLTLKVVIDKAETTEQAIFTVGDIYQSSFERAFIPIVDRASEIEVLYSDKDQNYNTTPITIFNTELATLSNKVTLYGIGITDQVTAWRLAMRHLAMNVNVKWTATFLVDAKALGSKIGDLIGIQHDVPQWGVGGRVLSSTSNTVTVDRDVEASGGNNEVQIQHSSDDDIETEAVDSVNGNIITITGTWTDNPDKDDVWLFGEENLKSMQAKILNTSIASDTKIKLEVVQYSDDNYAYEALEPDIPVEGLISQTTSDDLILRPITWDEITSSYPEEQVLNVISAATMDMPAVDNLEFTDDDPSAGFVSWAGVGGDGDITIVWRGVEYVIEDDSSNKKYLYWKTGLPTVITSSDSLNTVLSEDGWILAINESGTHELTTFQRVINGGLIKASSLVVTNADITDLAASKITAGTLGVGVIYAGSINADDISAGLLHADRLSSGLITTVKLALAAATISAYDNGGDTELDTPDWRECAAASITSVGGAVVINFSGYLDMVTVAGRNVDIEIRRSSTVIWSTSALGVTQANHVGISASVSDQPGSGSRSYNVRAKHSSSGGDVTLYMRSGRLSVEETKR